MLLPTGPFRRLAAPPTFDSGAASPRGILSSRIEFLRLAATLLLVSYHVVGNVPHAGLHLDYPHPLRLFADFFVDLRMPLFAFIAGIVYALRPVEDYRDFMRGKFRRLLIPGAVAATLFALASSMAGSNGRVDAGEFLGIYFFPYAHYWFLQSLFVIFSVFALIEAFTRKQIALAAIAVTVIASLLGVRFDIDVFSLNGAVYLAPYFALGVLWCRNSGNLPIGPRHLLAIAAAGLLVATAWSLVQYHQTGTFSGRRDLQSLLFGLSACVLLISVPFPNLDLRAFGAFSFTIYLYHVFGTAGTREALEALGILNIPLNFVLGVLGGFAVPVLLHLAMLRWPLGRRLILGIRKGAPRRPRPDEGTAAHFLGGTPAKLLDLLRNPAQRLSVGKDVLGRSPSAGNR